MVQRNMLAVATDLQASCFRLDAARLADADLSAASSAAAQNGIRYQCPRCKDTFLEPGECCEPCVKLPPSAAAPAEFRAVPLTPANLAEFRASILKDARAIREIYSASDWIASQLTRWNLESDAHNLDVAA